MAELADVYLFASHEVIVVDGVQHPVMTYDWVYPMVGAFLLTPVAVWLYRRSIGQPGQRELWFAIGLCIAWAVQFAAHEL